MMKKKTAADLKAKERNPDLHGSAWLIAVRERMLMFYFYKATQFINTLGHWMCYKFLIVETISKLARVSTVPCMCRSLSPSDSK